MSPALLDLARRAVACLRWRWMAGMRALTDVGGRVLTDAGGCWRVYLGTHGIICAQGDGNGGYVAGWDHTAAILGVLPDLADPATLGCLLALVREAWGDPKIHVLPARPPSAFGGAPWVCGARARLFTGASEAAALVAALEAAP